MKLALIDLDVIEKAIKHNRFENLRESAMVAAEIFEFVKADCSQPKLIELLRKAWNGRYADNQCGEFWMDIPTSFTEFLTQNNLTDEKDK